MEQLTLSVLILTHEGANEEDCDTYLQEYVYPCRPLVVYSRSAKKEPQCHIKEALWYCWKEVFETKQHHFVVVQLVRIPIGFLTRPIVYT